VLTTLAGLAVAVDVYLLLNSGPTMAHLPSNLMALNVVTLALTGIAVGAHVAAQQCRHVAAVRDDALVDGFEIGYTAKVEDQHS
jgi:hypothetical protein